jgi:hypothetical protein
VERRHAAKRELERLLDEAEAREQVAEVEAQATAARDAQRRGLELFLELHESATRIAEQLGALERINAEIRAANRHVTENGRADLKTPMPDMVLAQHLGLATPEALPRYRAWSLSGYMTRDGLGNALPSVKHQLDTARELLASPLSRAA